MGIVFIKSKENNMISIVFIWDWNEPVPYIEMLKYKHMCPTSHLYEYDASGTFTYLVFAPTKKIALREVRKTFSDGGSIEIYSSDINRIF